MFFGLFSVNINTNNFSKLLEFLPLENILTTVSCIYNNFDYLYWDI